jgi:hypothetical protein
MTFEPNVDSFRYEPYDPSDADGIVELELERMLTELEAALPPDVEGDGGDDRDRNDDH